jgi:hypothetical protein
MRYAATGKGAAAAAHCDTRNAWPRTSAIALAAAASAHLFEPLTDDCGLSVLPFLLPRGCAMSDLQTRAERLAAMKGQIAYFFGQERGYFPIDAGIRDDNAPTGIQMLLPSDDSPAIPNARTWYYHDPERPDLLALAAEAAIQKADAYGNVYITRTLFDRKRATKDVVKTSRIIAIEDAPAALPLPASRVLRTSPQSRQSFYRLTEAVSTTKAEKLSRLIARAMGADKSGVNANKVLRLCGGYNTKAKLI